MLAAACLPQFAFRTELRAPTRRQVKNIRAAVMRARCGRGGDLIAARP